MLVETAMEELGNLGRLLVIMGVVIVAIGALLMLFGRIPFLGRLPGDIRIERDNVTCFIPLATMLLLSLLLTLIINLLLRWPRR